MYPYTLMYLTMYSIKKIKQLCYLLPRNYQTENYYLNQRFNYFKNIKFCPPEIYPSISPSTQRIIVF